MNYTVTGFTIETDGISAEDLEKFKVFSGKNAGICYMKDKYFDSNVTDPKKALDRFHNIANINHHSIADHVKIEVLFEGISKMLAIVLNSLQDYSTSEKSGRYTVMTGNSDRERELYNKWKEIFHARILQLEPDIDDNELNKKSGCSFVDRHLIKGEVSNLNDLLNDQTLPSFKMAQENARYVLSVFTRSTTMGYSTSLRQWNYIYDWCQVYIKAYEYKTRDFFTENLLSDIKSLAKFIKDNLYVEELRDSKGRCFDFLTSYSGMKDHPLAYYDFFVFEPDEITGEYTYTEDTHSQDDNLGFMYNVAYTASFVHIAQAERHRTIQYYMVQDFGDPKQYEFFTPPMLKGTQYVEEWLEDLRSVAHLIPQATLIGIVECGSLPNFVLKCKERLCGKAQWEIMHQTKLTAERFIKGVERGIVRGTPALIYVEKLKSDKTGVTTKCQLCGGCKENCRYGAKKALTRFI